MRLLPHTERNAVATAPDTRMATHAEARIAPSSPSIVLTHDGWLIGHLVDVEGRVIDALVGRDPIGLMTDDGYREVDRDDVLALVPPTALARTELRIAKRQIPVTVELGDFVSVTGNCHLLPGATVWDVWQRSPSGFAALTEALLRFPDGSVETAEVVLVSRHAAATGLRRN